MLLWAVQPPSPRFVSGPAPKDSGSSPGEDECVRPCRLRAPLCHDRMTHCREELRCLAPHWGWGYDRLRTDPSPAPGAQRPQGSFTTQQEGVRGPRGVSRQSRKGSREVRASGTWFLSWTLKAGEEMQREAAGLAHTQRPHGAGGVRGP